jgi:hypothetical protein
MRRGSGDVTTTSLMNAFGGFLTLVQPVQRFSIFCFAATHCGVYHAPQRLPRYVTPCFRHVQGADGFDHAADFLTGIGIGDLVGVTRSPG